MRRQQEENAQPVKPQLRTEKSSQAIINQLKNRIKALDADKKELTRQNEALTVRLYSLGNTQDIIARLNGENDRLKTEVEKLRTELEATQKELDNCQQRLVGSNPKITSIEEKRTKPSTTNEIIDELKSQLNDVGIRLNKTLINLIVSAPESQVINALSVVKEALAVGKVKSKAGLFRKALEEVWTPNESDEKREVNAVRSSFAEWYDLARSYGIVIGCREEEGMMIVQENTVNWYRFEEFSSKWTLEYLRQSLSRTRS